jgi:RimJ/RimL family protein N-acetyltransferase
MSEVSKRGMLDSLPIREDGLTIRHWNPKDMEVLAAWPGYPFPYEAFDFSFRDSPVEERDRLFSVREARDDALTLVVDHESQRGVGYISLREIDWEDRAIGNMGIRIAPSWRNRGAGTQALCMVARWSFDCGIEEVRLDVAASNGGAIRSYEKAGFVKTGEFWREGQDLEGENIDQPRYDFLRPHLRREGGTLSIRFFWMRKRAP